MGHGLRQLGQSQHSQVKAVGLPARVGIWSQVTAIPGMDGHRQGATGIQQILHPDDVVKVAVGADDSHRLQLTGGHELADGGNVPSRINHNYLVVFQRNYEGVHPEAAGHEIQYFHSIVPVGAYSWLVAVASSWLGWASS